MYQILKAFFLFLCVLFVSFSKAYSQDFGSRPLIREVVSQDKSEFRKVVRDAFAEYLVRLSGNSEIVAFPKIPSLISSAEKYLLEFRYEPLAESDLKIVSEFEQDQQAKWRLKLNFDYKAVESTLFNLGAPIWPSPRPQLMVWLAYETEDGLREIVSSSDASSEYRSLLIAKSFDRGLSIAVPEDQTYDKQSLSPSALWGLFKDDIRLATEQLQLNNSLSARVYPLGEEGWAYQALLLMPNREEAFEGVALTKVEAINQLMQSGIDLMSSLYALQVDPNDQKALVLNIESIPHFDQLNYLMGDLNAHLMIKDVIPKSLKGDNVELAITYVGEPELLKITLASHSELQEVVKVDATELSGAPLVNDSSVQNNNSFVQDPLLDASSGDSSEVSSTEVDNAEMHNASEGTLAVEHESSIEEVWFYKYQAMIEESQSLDEASNANEQQTQL